MLLWMLGVILPCCLGCSGRPPSELTPEQLQKQIEEDKQSIADEDRLEAELKKKPRK
jgi:hypothetical protein